MPLHQIWSYSADNKRLEQVETMLNLPKANGMTVMEH